PPVGADHPKNGGKQSYNDFAAMRGPALPAIRGRMILRHIKPYFLEGLRLKTYNGLHCSKTRPPTMETPEFDIVISGAGPVGSALALLLAKAAPRPERIALAGRNFASGGDSAKDVAGDPRTLAMNHGSRAL